MPQHQFAKLHIKTLKLPSQSESTSSHQVGPQLFVPPKTSLWRPIAQTLSQRYYTTSSRLTYSIADVQNPTRVQTPVLERVPTTSFPHNPSTPEVCHLSPLFSPPLPSTLTLPTTPPSPPCHPPNGTQRTSPASPAASTAPTSSKQTSPPAGSAAPTRPGTSKMRSTSRSGWGRRTRWLT